jgi:flagellar hook-basal body complex protein FliE
MAIESISALTRTALAAPSTSDASAPGFGEALKDVLGAVDGSAGEANQAIGRMLEGTGDVHEAMIALQKADTMLQLTVQIRNKIVQAYQDIMRMPV